MKGNGEWKQNENCNPQFSLSQATSADIAIHQQQQPMLHLVGTHFISQGAHQPHQQPPPYNDLTQMHNPQPFTTSHGQTETYSMLPVGHGNFLKVYHCAETMANMAVDGNVYQQQQYMPSPPQQQQQAPVHTSYHVAHPPNHHHGPAQMFDSYELFSSPSLIPNIQNPSSMALDAGIHQTPVYLMSSNSSIVTEFPSQTSSTNQTANMIINKLVNNCSPNLTGGIYTQFGSPLPTQLQAQNQQSLQSSDTNDNAMNSLSSGHELVIHNNSITENEAILPVTIGKNDDNYAISTAVANTHLLNYTKTSQSDLLASNVVPTENVTSTGLAYSCTSTEVKKRIVAEVKPMRMTYSDVLSKVNSGQDVSNQGVNNYSYKHGNDGKLGNSIQFRESKGFSEMNGPNSFRRGITDETNGFMRNTMKKSPTHDNKENAGTINKQTKRSNQNSSNNAVPSDSGKNTINMTASKTLQIPQKQTQKQNLMESSINNTNITKKRAKRDPNQDGAKNSKSISEKDANISSTGANKRNRSSDSAQKTATSNVLPTSFTSNNNGNRNNKQNSRSSSSSTTNNSNAFAPSSSNSYASSRFSRYYNSSNAAFNSYSYSTKRNRGVVNVSSTSYDYSMSNRNYELAKKLLHTWLQFMLKILTWLYYLVYDIIVLGFSMVYDRLSQATMLGITYTKQLHRDIKENSNKPNVWLRNLWRRFDARFKKNSRLAFWRNFYKKKSPEPLAQSFKQGRLPQTGEEAMYSLLNCKGKDAYSILGVPPNSSQEQIRKHYKKIAVLVHPDKNKQPGAEEAFKVLQRAFELIGETDKRTAYDQSLAEALHAEKAWTELHDLLSQLQTKITEAASTIRCSTCGLRHPRRLVDRPPYAARECATCKIRHSAREGDIWAETTFLGLRWKYLALMEGKVYDITEWANCQKGALAHLEPNSHLVQYRIVRGAQQQQHQQTQQQQQQPAAHQHHHQQHSPHRNQFGNGMFKHDFPSGDATLHEFLDNLYSGQNPNNLNAPAHSGSSRRRNRRN